MSLAMILIFLALTSSVNGSRTGPSCEVLEQPENIEASCTVLYVKLGDDVKEVEFLETPLGTIDEQTLKQLVQEGELIKKNLNTEDSVIPFPRIHPSAMPKEGIYLIRINDEYNIRIRYGGDFNTKAVIEGITFYGGIGLLLAGVLITKWAKHKGKGKMALVIGALLFLAYIITLFVSI